MSKSLDQSEAALVEAARNGDVDALDILVQRHLPRVRRFTLKMCGQPDDADDVSQDTFVAVAGAIGAFRGEASFTSWLYSIARSFCIKKRRRSKFAPRRVEQVDHLDAQSLGRLSSSVRTPEEDAVDHETAAALDAALRRLEPMYREVLILRDIEGLSAPEVADALGLNLHTVKTRLHRARLAMRAALAPMLGLESEARSDFDKCTRVLQNFSAHMEGDLTPDKCAEMESHISVCPRCGRDCQALRRTLAICRDSSLAPVPLALERAVRNRIRIVLEKH